MDFLPCDPEMVRDRLYDSVQDEHSADSETGKTWQGHWKNPNILLCITMSNLVTGTEHSSARSFDGQNKGRPKSRSKAKHLRRPQNEWRLAPGPSRRSDFLPKDSMYLYIHPVPPYAEKNWDSLRHCLWAQMIRFDQFLLLTTACLSVLNPHSNFSRIWRYTSHSSCPYVHLYIYIYM